MAMTNSPVRDACGLIARCSRLRLLGYFQHGASKRDGSMVFQFLRQPLAESAWDEYLTHRRLNAVVGVIDCQVCDDLSAACDQFYADSRRFRNVYLMRCFAFEPSEDMTDSESRVVLVPNQGPDRVSFYVSTMLADLATSLLHKFGQRVHQLQQVSTIIVPSDPPESLKTKVAEQFKAKKRGSARVAKVIADLCLMGGATVEAAGMYQSALDTAKGQNDFVAVAGALEGVYAAQAILAAAQSAPVGFKKGMIDLYKDIISNYEKAGAHLCVIEVRNAACA